MVYVILPCHTYYNSVTCADAWFLYYPSQSLSYYNRSCGMLKYEIYKQLASGDAIDMLLWQNTMLV